MINEAVQPTPPPFNPTKFDPDRIMQAIIQQQDQQRIDEGDTKRGSSADVTGDGLIFQAPPVAPSTPPPPPPASPPQTTKTMDQGTSPHPGALVASYMYQIHQSEQMGRLQTLADLAPSPEPSRARRLLPTQEGRPEKKICLV